MISKWKWRCRLLRTFFGLSDEYIESVYEQMFLLKHHGGWSFIEAYSLPIQIRHWFVRRLKRHFEEEKEEMEKAQRNSKRR